MSKKSTEMRDKWCPMARLRASDGAYNRIIGAGEDNTNQMIYGHSLCIAQLCAMWVPDSNDDEAGDCGLKTGVK